MLDTLLKIGQWQSEGVGEWDRFLVKLKVEYEDKKGNFIKNYTLPIIFDLDKMEVVVEASNLKEYDQSDILEFKALKIQGGNNKAIYATVPSSKFIQLYKTFFGKEGNEKAEEGELMETINKGFSQFQETKLYSILQKIFVLKEKFVSIATYEDTKNKKISSKAIEETLKLQKNENLTLIYVEIKASDFGIKKSIPLAKLQDYNDFLTLKFIGSRVDKSSPISSKTSLCYVSGELDSEVNVPDLSNRYSLNKMFVTETRNYASFFNRANFNINYQVSKDNQEKLDYASTFLLDKYKTRIANIDHVIIPQFLSKSNIDIELTLNGIKKKSDLLFNFKALEAIKEDIRMETEDIFWISFVAFESDGNFFKSTEIIKDVSQFHFQKVLKTFHDINWELKDENFVNWDSVITEFGTKDRFFNLNSIYALIPIRKDKVKKNVALDLFKAILENRKVDRQHLFVHFKDLILCHYYQRYNSYTNIPKSSPDYFRKTVRDIVFKYLAFFKVLEKLNLIKMDSSNQLQTTELTASEKQDEIILKFFERMNLNQAQKAMFYLGRMLNSVSFKIQQDKKKTVIDKVNFNGMDRDDIVRLRISLFEKAKQYGQSVRIVFDDNKFGEHFDFKRWDMDPNEAVFFLLTGFSFGIKSGGEKDKDPIDDKK